MKFRIYKSHLSEMAFNGFLAKAGGATHEIITLTNHAFQRAYAAGRITLNEAAHLVNLKSFTFTFQNVAFVNFVRLNSMDIPISFGAIEPKFGVPISFINSVSPVALNHSLHALHGFGTREGHGLVVKTILTRARGGITSPANGSPVAEDGSKILTAPQSSL